MIDMVTRGLAQLKEADCQCRCFHSSVTQARSDSETHHKGQGSAVQCSAGGPVGEAAAMTEVKRCNAR